MSDELKIVLNIMQDRLVLSSDNILLIFDKREQLERYKKEKQSSKPSNEILITINELLSPNSLVGLRFRRYWFMTDRDL